MTATTMGPRELLEKNADTEFLREMIGFTVRRLMALEVETLTGATHDSRSADRVTYRNGYRGRAQDIGARPSSCAYRKSAKAVTSPASSSRGGWARRRWRWG